MAGGAQSDPNFPKVANPQTAQAAQGGGAVSSPADLPTAQTASNMPQWQRGLMGLMTGSAQYGQNAPAIHGLMQAAISSMAQGQQRAQQAPMQAPMGGGGPQQGPPPAAQAFGAPQAPMGQMGQGGITPQMGGINPQMLAQLRAQYPQLFGGQ